MREMNSILLSPKTRVAHAEACGVLRRYLNK
jgi:exonuclease V gamma subunit